MQPLLRHNHARYDAENRLLTAGGVTYTYDGDGRRLKKSNGKLYWYGPETSGGSDPLTETDLAGTPSAEFIFFNGKRIARLDLPGAVVHYYFSDHLGSASVVTSLTVPPRWNDSRVSKEGVGAPVWQFLGLTRTRHVPCKLPSRFDRAAAFPPKA